MTLDKLRDYCLSLPHVTEGVQWVDHLLFRVGNRMFTVASLDPASEHRMSFKCTPEQFAELIEREGIVPAPYMSRNHWIALETYEALDDREIRKLVKKSYDLVFARLPVRLKRELSS